jgi:hypothetical protein
MSDPYAKKRRYWSDERKANLAKKNREARHKKYPWIKFWEEYVRLTEQEAEAQPRRLAAVGK